MTQTESAFWAAAAEFDIARQRQRWPDMGEALDKMFHEYFVHKAAPPSKETTDEFLRSEGLI